MASVCEDGVYQLEDGYWAYRFSIIVDGRRISRKKRTDEQGKKLRTRKLALKAREAAIGAAYPDLLCFLYCTTATAKRKGWIAEPN